MQYFVLSLNITSREPQCNGEYENISTFCPTELFSKQSSKSCPSRISDACAENLEKAEVFFE